MSNLAKVQSKEFHGYSIDGGFLTLCIGMDGWGGGRCCLGERNPKHNTVSPCASREGRAITIHR